VAPAIRHGTHSVGQQGAGSLTGGIVVLGQQVVDGLYLLMDDGEILIILVYVDDPLLVASSLAAIYKMKDALHKRFEMKDL